MTVLKQYYDYSALLFSIIISAILRIAIPYSMVFQNGKTIYNSMDAYYYLRYADLLQSNYPQYQFYDQYLNTSFGNNQLWGVILSWFGRTFGNMDMWAAYIPAILGILILVPVFIIVKSIFKDKLITSIAIILCAIISGIFYARTQLGAADRHALDIILLTTLMAEAILFITNKGIIKKLILSVLFIGTYWLYYLTWGINSFIVIIILAIAIYVWIVIKQWVNNRTLSYILLVIPVAGFLFILLSQFGYFGDIGSFVSRKLPLFAQSSVSEEWPLLFMYASDQSIMLDLSTTWGYFGLLFFAMIVGIGMLLYKAIKYKKIEDTLLLTWSIVMILLTIIMRRWAYYSAINVVILASFSMVIIVRALVSIKGNINARRLWLAIIIGIVFIVVPFIRNDIGIARNSENYVSKGWQDIAGYLSHKEPKENRILSWWDYGYYLCRESHIAVVCHGGGVGQKESAKLLLSEDENIIDKLKENNIKYIAIDSKMTDEYFYAIVTLSGYDIKDYYVNNSVLKTIEQKPKYYNTLLVSLYVFNDIEGIELLHSSEDVKLFEVK